MLMIPPFPCCATSAAVLPLVSAPAISSTLVVVAWPTTSSGGSRTPNRLNNRRGGDRRVVSLVRGPYIPNFAALAFGSAVETSSSSLVSGSTLSFVGVGSLLASGMYSPPSTTADGVESSKEEEKRVYMALDRGLRSAAALAKPVSSAVCSSGDWPGKGAEEERRWRRRRRIGGRWCTGIE